MLYIVQYYDYILINHLFLQGVASISRIRIIKEEPYHLLHLFWVAMLLFTTLLASKFTFFQPLDQDIHLAHLVVNP